MKTDIKQKPLDRFRSSVVRDVPAAVDPKGGRYGAGLIRGASAITAGEALGHGAWIDSAFLDSVAGAINAAGSDGLKMRFTHPDVSSDGMGKYLGKAVGATVVDNSVVIDAIHLSKSATKSPDGNLAEYVMSLAQESPGSFGLSIVFGHDTQAEDAHYKANSVDGVYRSPDPANVDNLPHVRLKALHAVDVVDDPAANPRGLFHRENVLASEASAMAKFVLGLEDTAPATIALGLDAGRTRAFVSRFLAEHNLELKEVSGMSQDTTKPDGDPNDEQATAGTSTDTAEQVGEETKPDEPKAEESAPGQLSNGRKFLEAFGDKGGVWYAEGKTFEEASSLFFKQMREENAALRAEIEEYKTRLARGRKAFASVDDGGEFQASGDRPKRISLSEAVKIAGRG